MKFNHKEKTDKLSFRLLELLLCIFAAKQAPKGHDTKSSSSKLLILKLPSKRPSNDIMYTHMHDIASPRAPEGVNKFLNSD